MVYNRRSFSFTLFLQVVVGIRQEFVPAEVSRDCARSCAVHGGMAPELNAHGATGPCRSGRSSFGLYSRAGRLGFWVTRKGFKTCDLHKLASFSTSWCLSKPRLLNLHVGFPMLRGSNSPQSSALLFPSPNPQTPANCYL